MIDDKRHEILKKIDKSIQTQGYHLRIVQGGPLPIFAYTIGLFEKLGFEIVFAGGLYFSTSEIRTIMNAIADRVLRGERGSLCVGEFGKFQLNSVHDSWSSKMLLGSIDYFDTDQIISFQVFPDHDHWTVDVPDMQTAWSYSSEPIWCWLEDDWSYAVSPKSVAITNLDALRGHLVTEVMRWEVDSWEMFAGAGPDIRASDLRTAPLGTMFELDPSLRTAASLEIGTGQWRSEDACEWIPWKAKEVS